jgi:hypothetical protein
LTLPGKRPEAKAALQLDHACFDLGEIKNIIIYYGEKRVPAAANDLKYSLCVAVRSSSSRRSVRPMTAFIGVLISWLILARNSDLALFAASASFFP